MKVEARGGLGDDPHFIKQKVQNTNVQNAEVMVSVCVVEGHGRNLTGYQSTVNTAYGRLGLLASRLALDRTGIDLFALASIQRLDSCVLRVVWEIRLSRRQTERSRIADS